MSIKNYGGLSYIFEDSVSTLEIVDNSYEFEPLDITDFLKNNSDDATIKREIKIIIHENVRASVYEIIDSKNKTRKQAISFHVGAHAHVTYTCAVVGANGPLEQNINLVLSGQGAAMSVYGAYFLSENDDVIIRTRQEHRAQATRSDLVIKSALFNKARIDYTGLIHINEHAARTSATQKNVNLLMGSQAHARSVPSIEVLTDDVQCAHGAAIGRLDQELYFYMQSRGLEHAQATMLMLEGFFVHPFVNHKSDVIKRLLNETIRELS